MQDLLNRLEALDAMMAEVVADALTGGTLRIADEAELVHCSRQPGASADGSTPC